MALIDPHPGNIFVLDDGRIGLIDFGQVKQISGRNRETLAKVMIALDEREDGNLEDMERIGNLALELGVEIKEDAKDEAPAAIALWLFDGSATELPGGYDMGELSPNSPVKELKSFPQDLVLAGIIRSGNHCFTLPVCTLISSFPARCRSCSDFDQGCIQSSWNSLVVVT